MSDGGRLAGKVAVVTGSTAGIGLASAKRFAEEGARVVVSDHGAAGALADEAVEAVRAAGGDGRYRRADVRDTGQVRELIRYAIDEFGGIDVLMNNAWGGDNAAVVEMTDESWDAAFASSVKAVAAACQLAIPEMTRRGGGAIINTSSVHGLLAGRRCAPYSAMKAALLNLTRQMAVEYGRANIRVNALCPGRILTEAKVRWLADNPDEVRRQHLVYPLGWPGTLEEIASAALFLACDESSFVTGQALVVDGGLTAQLQDTASAVVEKGVLEQLGLAGQ